MHLRAAYKPAARLSAPAAMVEFMLPSNTISHYIATTFDLVWAVFDGQVQPLILHPELFYPGHRPATQAEIDRYKNHRPHRQHALPY